MSPGVIALIMLGILVIPMSPSSTYLAGDPARITANVEEATGGGKFDQKFGAGQDVFDAMTRLMEHRYGTSYKS